MVENLTLNLYTDMVSRALELRPEIERFLQSETRNPDLAQDLVQDTYLKILEHPAQFNPQRGTLRGWMMRIAHNAYVDHVRANFRRPTVELIEEHDTESYEFTDQVDSKLDAQKELDLVLPSLTEAQVKVAELYSNDYSTSEIARELEKPLGTIKAQLYRAHEKARKLAPAYSSI